MIEMANLRKSVTGIPNIVINILVRSQDDQTEHGPRVKVSNILGTFDRNNNFSIRIHDLYYDKSKVGKDTKKYLKSLLEFVEINRDELTRLYNMNPKGKLDLSKLKKVKYK